MILCTHACRESGLRVFCSHFGVFCSRGVSFPALVLSVPARVLCSRRCFLFTPARLKCYRFPVLRSRKRVSCVQQCFPFPYRCFLSPPCLRQKKAVICEGIVFSRGSGARPGAGWGCCVSTAVPLRSAWELSSARGQMYAPVLAGAAGSPPLCRCDLRGNCPVQGVGCHQPIVMN